MLTQADVDAIIKDWMNSSAGKQYLHDIGAGIYTEKEMQEIASKLRSELIFAFFSVQKTGGAVFDGSATAINVVGENHLSIVFKPQALRRKSLLSPDNQQSTYAGGRKKLTKSNIGYTGNGLRDIFAAFTSGWHASNYVYGSWEDAYQTGIMVGNRSHDRTFIRSRKDFEGSSFIRDTVAMFEAQYPGLKITIPAEWGG
jgi:hypothetical protein